MKVYHNALVSGITRIITFPSLSIPLILSLGLTLGAILTVISISYTLIFKVLPGIENESHLYNIAIDFIYKKGITGSTLDWHRFAFFEKKFQHYGTWGAINSNQIDISIKERNYTITKLTATPNILNVFGTKLIKGKNPLYSTEKNQVWISKHLWKSIFNANPEILNKEIVIKDKEYIINGVFENIKAVKSNKLILSDQILFIIDPKSKIQLPEQATFNNSVPGLILRTDKKPPTESQLRTYFYRYFSEQSVNNKIEDFANSFPLDIKISSYRNNLMSDSKNIIMILILAAVGLFCMSTINLINLFLSHYQARLKEFSIKMTVGSSPSILYITIFLENIPTFILSGLLGLITCTELLAVTPKIATNIPLINTINISPLTILSTVIIIIVLNGLFSALPFIFIINKTLKDNLSSSGKGGQAQVNHSLSKLLMIVQLCLASIIVYTSIMLSGQSYHSVYRALGFTTDNAYLVSFDYAEKNWEEELSNFKDYSKSELKEVQDNIESIIKRLIPNSKVVSSDAPLTSNRQLKKLSDPAINNQFLYQIRNYTADYFNTFGISFIAGAEPDKQDIDNGYNSIIIDERMAKMSFPDIPLINIPGKKLSLMTSAKGEDYIIAGVVKNILSSVGNINKASFPTVYHIPRDVNNKLYFSFITNTNTVINKNQLALSVYRQYPRLKNMNIQSLDMIWSAQTQKQRICLYLTLALTALALFLAIIGLVGLTQMITAQRLFELAIRMAVGARQQSLLLFIFRNILWMIVIGLGLAFGTSIICYQWTNTHYALLPRYSPTTMLAIDILFITVVIGAVAFPGWKVIRTNPIKVLRDL